MVSTQRALVMADPAKYTELAQYRGIIQKANRKFRWKIVYDFDVQFRMSLSGTAGRVDHVASTLYTTIFNSSAVRKEGISCQRCKSEHHLVRDCPFRAKQTVEETKAPTKAGSAADQWKYEKWFHNNIEGCILFQRRACQQGKECKRAHVCKACRGDHAMADCKPTT